jgi:hypothetical protein
MKSALILLFVGFLSSYAFSQIQIDERSGHSIKERGYGGIGIGGLSLGSNGSGTYYSIGLTPQAGYMINQYVSTGFAFEYRYFGFTNPQAKGYSQYGWYPFLRFNIQKFFIQTDYDWYSIPVSSSNDRKIFNRFLLGAGYFQQGRGRGGMNFLISYDMLYSANSPFNSPLSIRIFYTF